MTLFAIFGDPVAHSRSPLLHNAAFAALGLPHGGYDRIRLLDGAKLRERFDALGLAGANITVPHKEHAFAQADEVRGAAWKIGAVNTWVREHGRVVAYNTDAPGFLESLPKNRCFGKVLILGAGGTARALAVAFEEAGATVTVLNRSAGRLGFFGDLGVCTSEWEGFEPSGYDLVVNTTSAGLTDESLPAPEPLLTALFQYQPYVVDVIYGKTTPFLAFAKRSGLMCQDGAGMLIWQAVLAFEKFVPGCDRERVLGAMKKAMAL